MDSEDAYDAHRQEDISCKKRPEPADDRLRPQVLKSKLDFKKAPYTNAKSTEEKWRMVFGRLFPGEEVPSPYDQHGFTSRQERILSEVLEDELTRELGPASGIRIHRIKTQTLQAFRRRLMSISLENEDTVTRKSKSMEIPEDNTTVTPETENDYTPTSSQATMSSADMNNASHTIAGFVESLPKTRPANPQRCHPSPSACSTEGIQESLYESSPTNIFCSSTSLPSSYATDLTRSEVYGSTEDIQTCNYPPSLRRFFPQRRPQIPLSRTQSSHLWSPSDPKGNPTQYSDGALSFSNDMHTILEEPFQMMESTSLFEENGEEEWAWDAYPVSMEESGSRLEYSPAKDQRNGYQ
ncbi:hypothetical protein BU26DRAFT_301100 [Trematosphaeria pertusa]|uniref:Uncharacterized protein n=1 Tax=Trematosphaeria pertusa TaxID=390896 RepID=A0A6A6IKM8_9PLEO|nr:uncharacterized protein BU26DRAFT_301100 [Trematosphaeria pertusa]KAF2250402.1 hypothetical protein BU26DRAFT_301100 [Trematosphaeria pertusa]